MQKYISLKTNPGHLITDGLFKKSKYKLCWRILIYLSFALLSMHWLTIAILIVFIGIVWVPNMIKDKSYLGTQSLKIISLIQGYFYNEKLLFIF